MSQEQNAKPKCRRFRFGLRTLLVFVAVASAGFGWLGYKIRQAQQQRTIAETIEELDGIVMYDCEMNSSSMPPRWLLQLVGIDLLGTIKKVSLTHTRVADDDLLKFRDLPAIDYLSLFNTHITDAGLVHLKELNQLTGLDLSRTEVTDAGLIHLHGLRNLERISLVETRVTDAGVEKLQKAMPNLEIELNNLP